MSKIICDICGTSYPETAKQCPICGCVRPGDVQRVTNEVKRDGKVSIGYTYVKGGRFSKSSVKKRTQTGGAAFGAEKATARQNHQTNPDEKSNRGLVITAIVLLLAIIGVVIYIAVRFFGPISGPADNTTTSNTQQNADQVLCTDLVLDINTILFEQEGEGRLLQVEPKPKDTKEPIAFRSENEEVASVSDAGKVTAVGEGTTKIIITCGNVTKECVVTVQLTEESSSDTTEDSSSDTTGDDTTGGEQHDKPAEELRLNRKDITFSVKGESWVLYSGSIAKNLITWSSGDESVVTFIDGKATAVGGGTTTVYAEYEGQKVSCIIRCSFKESSGIGGNGGVSEDGGSNGSAGEDGGNSSGVITGTVNVQEYLNVRKEPNVNAEKVGTLKPNEKVTITEQKTVDGMTWGKISTGWISMNYIIVD